MGEYVPRDGHCVEHGIAFHDSLRAFLHRECLFLVANPKPIANPL